MRSGSSSNTPTANPRKSSSIRPAIRPSISRSKSATATRERIYERPWLYPKQAEAIFAPTRYSCIEASTKCGKTVGCIIWLLENAMQGRSGQNFWWIAPIYGQAKIAFRRSRRALPLELYTANETELTITLVNGATIWFKGADTPDSLYGEDVYAAVVDEASRVKEEAWHALRSTLTYTQGPVRLIGNVKGRKNWFYRMARLAEQGSPDMHYARLVAKDAVDAGVLQASEVEDARLHLPAIVFDELYNAIPSPDGGNPFGLDHIAACVQPLSSAEPVIWGWDLARSIDFTVGIALDAEGRVCRLERFHESWPGTKAKILASANGVTAVVESNMDHDQMIEDLERAGHANFRGFRTTANSKQEILEGLAVAIQQHTIGFPDGIIRQELETFEYIVSRSSDGRVRTYYSAPEGLHDDCVIALAIAWRHWNRMPPLLTPISFEAKSRWW